MSPGKYLTLGKMSSDNMKDNPGLGEANSRLGISRHNCGHFTLSIHRRILSVITNNGYASRYCNSSFLRVGFRTKRDKRQFLTFHSNHNEQFIKILFRYDTISLIKVKWQSNDMHKTAFIFRNAL